MVSHKGIYVTSVGVELSFLLSKCVYVEDDGRARGIIAAPPYHQQMNRRRCMSVSRTEAIHSGNRTQSRIWNRIWSYTVETMALKPWAIEASKSKKSLINWVLEPKL